MLSDQYFINITLTGYTCVLIIILFIIICRCFGLIEPYIKRLLTFIIDKIVYKKKSIGFITSNRKEN